MPLTPIEIEIRNKLGVPSSATQVLILEQSAHCDWDWLATFDQYYAQGADSHQPVAQTLNEAVSYIQNYVVKPPPPYVYTFCEMGYLRRYLHDNPSQVTAIKQFLPGIFNISSGGIVSADNLLSHGEAFIRNYLIGRQWVEHALGITPSLQMWIPDDFGHDAQLPIVLLAMGFMGAGFWRIPAEVGAPHVTYAASPNAPNGILNASIGLDFTWQAADGSGIQAHWLSNSYGEGNLMYADQNNNITWDSTTQGNINTLIYQNLYLSTNQPLPQPTPYLFVPVDNDFVAPYANLPDIITAWNNCNGWGQTNNCVSNPSYTSGVYAVMATFDDFMQLVQAHTAPLSGNSPLSVYCSNPTDVTQPAFVPNPYYSGAYGSRPALKNLHYQTTRKLLFAESMQVILNYLGSVDPAGWSKTAAEYGAVVADAWDRLMPSTHHDYIPGTSGVSGPQPPPIKDLVYSTEQLPDLQKVHSDANGILGGILGEIALTINPGQTAGTPVAVFNPVGFGRSGIAETALPVGGGAYQSSTLDGVTYTPVQQTGRNTLLLMADAPSIGYQCAYLSDTPPTFQLPLSLNLQDGSYVMENQFLSATIEEWQARQ